ncbi:hypothetical protein RFI_32934, partial [Reticulomyxa filosa]
MISCQKDTVKKKKGSPIEYPTVERSKLGERQQCLQSFLKSRSSKADITKKGILEKKNMTPQLRPILRIVRSLGEHNEDNIVTKRHHEQAFLNICLNEFVNKAALNQIAKGYFTTHNRRLADFDDNSTPVDSNDVNEPSMIWQVQYRKRNYYNDPYYSTTRDYVVGDRVELTNNRKD